VDARTSEVLRAKAELFTNQILLKSIIDSSTAIIYAKDLDGYYILVNKQFQELFGDTNADLRGLTDQEVFPPEVAEQMLEVDRRVINSGGTVETEDVMFHHGERRTYISVRYPLRDVNGRIYAVCCIATDISERVREETTLRRLNEMLVKRLTERLRDGSAGNSPTIAD
ncbi:MAG: PAS domain-containing protein, partial [Noviherbaspirillum sp.]